ncbi:MAG: hypothetical protein MJA29_11680 [Candidatus Omnitrophica bacterium]|nr:hypothetical protein [Candidatus Omnitrophota bacterium]
MRGLSKREKITAGITLAVVIVSVGYRFVFMPWNERRQRLDAQLSLMGKQWRNYAALLSRQDLISSRFKEVFSSAGPVDPALDAGLGVISELESLGRQNGMQIIDIRPQGGGDSQRALYREDLYTLRTKGAVESYLKFIYALEHSLSLLHIRRVALIAKPQSQEIEGVFTLSQVRLTQ